MEEAGCRWERPRQCLAAGAAGKEVLREDKAEQGGAGMVVERCANSGLQMGVGPPTGCCPQNGCPSVSLCSVTTPSRLSCLSVSRCMQSSKRNHPLQAALLPRLGKRSWICHTILDAARGASLQVIHPTRDWRENLGPCSSVFVFLPAQA
ncbi:hypothetical protein Q9966_002452 [Columba livia]|nr:hypothetical protein Q9966_002452 [Columba livia]KAK2543584.1 hypothetical protein Q9966_002452 [Columba livia]